MIKPEQIPYEVKMRMRAVLLDGETDEAVAIAAAINVWPGVEVEPTHEGYPAWPHIILPLPEENNNDQG
jgi:hypothetical protein